MFNLMRADERIDIRAEIEPPLEISVMVGFGKHMRSARAVHSVPLNASESRGSHNQFLE